MTIFKTRLLRIILIPMMAVSLTNCALVGRTVGMAAALVPMAISIIPIKLLFSCIPEGMEIDTPDGPKPIETLRPGDEVIGFSGKPVRIMQMHGYVEDPEGERFHEITFDNGAVVRLCDMHRIDSIPANEVTPGAQLGGQTVQSVKVYGGVERSYDLLTEDDGYRISGIPVNSMIEEMLEAAKNGAQSVPE